MSEGAVGDPLVAVGAATSEAMRLAEEYVKLGDFHFQAEQFENAAEAYAKARNYMPEDASVHLVLADAVFANAGYGLEKPVLAASPEEIRRIFDVNLVAAIDLMRATGLRLRAERFDACCSSAQR